MTRLKHSPKAFVRSLQMSTFRLFAFVEGWSDRFFYDKLCFKICTASSVMHEIRTAAELPGTTVGKPGLLRWYTYLRRSRLLINNFKGKRMAVVFFLDKDIDDFLRTKKRSSHVIYTEYHSVENYIFRHADLAEATAAVASLDIASIRTGLGNQRKWLRKAAFTWKDWVTLCVAARSLRVPCQMNYSVQSQINTGVCGPVSSHLRAQFKSDLQRASGLASKAFKARFSRAAKHVDILYGRDLQDGVFKGNWYLAFLMEDIKSIAGARSYNANALGRGVLPAATLLLDFTQPWAAHLTWSLAKVVSHL